MRRFGLVLATSLLLVALTGAHAEAGWQSSPEYGQAIREFVNEVI